MFVAHMYLLNRQNELNPSMDKHDGFDSLPQGALVDVEYIIGVRAEPKKPEQVPA